MTHQLRRGTALVLRGPQGSGKSTLARSIAESHGTYTTVDGQQLRSSAALTAALLQECETVIVDGGPVSDEALALIEELLTADTARVQGKHRPAVTVKVPHFILCTGDTDPLNLDPDARRFRVVDL